MKKIIVLVMALCLSCSAMAKGAACPKGQWLNGKKCAACPTGGICDGNTMKCNTGNRWVQSGSKCVCQGYWKYKSSKDPNHCYACPKNATCNGGNGAAGIKCNKGFVLSGEQCVADKNAKATNTKTTKAVANSCNGYLLNGKCVKCPSHGVCNGTASYKCEKGYTASLKTDLHGNWTPKWRTDPICVKLKDSSAVGEEYVNGKVNCPKGTRRVQDGTYKTTLTKNGGVKHNPYYKCQK